VVGHPLGELQADFRRLSEEREQLRGVVAERDRKISELSAQLEQTKSRVHDEAAEHFKRAIRLKPKIGIYHYNLAGIHRRNEDVDAAIGELTTALRFDPELTQAYKNAGYARFMARDDKGDTTSQVIHLIVKPKKQYPR